MSYKIILCIDDEKIVLDSLKEEILNCVSHNYIVETAQSAEEADEIIEEILLNKQQLELIICDYQMPGIKGDEFLIQAYKKVPQAMSIMLTGQASVDNIANIINRAYLYRYIAKPWQKEDLQLTIHQALQNYANQEKLKQYQINLEKTITERTQALKEAHEIAHIGTIDWNLKNDSMYWSNETYKIFGLPLQQPVNPTIDDYLNIIHPSEVTKTLYNLQKVQRDTKIFNYQNNCKIMQPNGNICYLQTKGKILRDKAGKAIEMVLTLHDITEITKTKKVLEKYVEIVNKNVLVISINLNKEITYVSNALLDLTGFTKEELLGQKENILYLEYKIWEYIIIGNPFSSELQITKKDKTNFWVNFIASPIYDEAEKLIGYTAILQNINDKKKLEKWSKKLSELNIQLNEQNAELIEASQLRDDIERITRHDLKAPVNSMITLPRILLEYENLDEDQREMLKAIEDVAYRMMNMINLSLDLYKMEQGRYKFKPEKVNLVSIINKSIRDLKTLIANTQVNVEFLVEDDKYIQADELLCYTIFVNVIKNAIEASPAKETVTISITSIEKYYQTTIYNKGAVPEDMKTRFFDKYSTSGKEEGTGLGTYSAKLMTEVQAGEIILDTNYQNATAIIIKFLKI